MASTDLWMYKIYSSKKIQTSKSWWRIIQYKKYTNTFLFVNQFIATLCSFFRYLSWFHFAQRDTISMYAGRNMSKRVKFFIR